MKIVNIECVPVQAPGRTLVVIIVETDKGIIGVGEAGLQRRPKAIMGAVEHLRRWLIGEDPRRIEHLWQRMFRGGFYPADRLIGSALAGIDVALWDIKGKMLNRPVYDLLGGRCRHFVQCFLSPTYRSKTARGTKYDGSAQPGLSTAESARAMATLANECLEDGHQFF